MPIDPVTGALVLGGIGASIPLIQQAFSSEIDPSSPEFQRRRRALQAQITGAPETGTAFAGAERETFGALAGSRGVGAEQAALAEALRAQAEGRGPSLAQMQYERALQGAQAAAQSQLASARGLSPAQAQRLMLTRQAGAQAAAASQSAQLRLQEQQAAQAALGNLLGQRRQQELLGGQLAAGLYGQAGSLGMQRALEQARLDQMATAGAMGLEQYEQQRATQAAGAATGAIGAGMGALTAGRGGGGTNITINPGGSASVQGAGQATASQMSASGAGLGSGGASIASQLKGVARGGDIKSREIPGKAKYKGDTRSNDTVPALLSPGEIVLPRTVAQSEDAPDKAKKFVQAIKKQKRPSPKAWAEAVARLNELESRLNAMEALADLEAEEEG
jgi:hypothetical protein